jgi:hypothetical protein
MAAGLLKVETDSMEIDRFVLGQIAEAFLALGLAGKDRARK